MEAARTAASKEELQEVLDNRFPMARGDKARNMPFRLLLTTIFPEVGPTQVWTNPHPRLSCCNLQTSFVS